MFFKDEILLEDINGLFVHFLILNKLQLLDLVNESTLLRDNDHWVLTLLIEEVLLAALEDEVAAL